MEFLKIPETTSPPNLIGSLITLNSQPLLTADPLPLWWDHSSLRHTLVCYHFFYHCFKKAPSNFFWKNACLRKWSSHSISDWINGKYIVIFGDKYESRKILCPVGTTMQKHFCTCTQKEWTTLRLQTFFFMLLFHFHEHKQLLRYLKLSEAHFKNIQLYFHSESHSYWNYRNTNTAQMEASWAKLIVAEINISNPPSTTILSKFNGCTATMQMAFLKFPNRISFLIWKGLLGMHCDRTVSEHFNESHCFSIFEKSEIQNKVKYGFIYPAIKEKFNAKPSQL